MTFLAAGPELDFGSNLGLICAGDPQPQSSSRKEMMQQWQTNRKMSFRTGPGLPWVVYTGYFAGRNRGHYFYWYGHAQLQQIIDMVDSDGTKITDMLQ